MGKEIIGGVRMKKLKLIFMVFVIVVLFPLTVLADVDAVSNIGVNNSIVASICNQANSACGKTILSYNGSTGNCTFSNAKYSELTMEEKQSFMITALEATQKSDLGTQQKNKLYNFIAKQDNTTSAAIKYLKSDASADFVEAKNWLRPFTSPVSTVIGVICLVTFMFIAMSMLFDIAYLSLPMMQWVLERGKTTKPFGVSREAWQTMKDMNSSEYSHRNILSVYCSKRVPVIIVCSICLGYVISGKIYDVMTFFVDAFSAI